MSDDLNDELPLGLDLWTHADTRAWLTRFPLPADFQWKDRDGLKRLVLPTYKLSGGYGKWLQETPYFPGLFELCHDILMRAPADADISPEWLAGQCHERAKPKPLSLL